MSLIEDSCIVVVVVLDKGRGIDWVRHRCPVPPFIGVGALLYETPLGKVAAFDGYLEMAHSSLSSITWIPV